MHPPDYFIFSEERFSNRYRCGRKIPAGRMRQVSNRQDKACAKGGKSEADLREELL